MLHECFHLKQGQELRPGMLDVLDLIAGGAAQLLPRDAYKRGSCSLQAWVLSDVKRFADVLLLRANSMGGKAAGKNWAAILSSSLAF